MAENIAELLVSLGLDTANFDKNITQVNRTTKNLEKSFKESQKAIKLNEDSMESYSNALKAGENLLGAYKNKLEILNSSYDKHKTNLEGLIQRQKDLPKEINESKEALKELADTLGTGSEEYKRAKDDLDKLKAEYNGMDKSISNAVNSLRNVEVQIQQTSNKIRSSENDIKNFNEEIKKLGNSTGLESLKKQMDKVSEKSKELAESLDKIKDKTEKISAGGAVALGAMSASLIETDNASMKLQGGLGLTTEETEVLTQKARELAKKGFDMSEATESLTKVKQVMGDSLNPEQVDELSRHMMALNKVFEVDTQDALKAVSSMTKQFGIDGEEAIDIIVTGFQNGLDMSGDWIDSLWEYSTYFSDLGFTAEETLAIIARGMQEGTFNTDKMADMLKEGKIRLLEMNDASKQAIESIGLSAETVQKNIGAGGETAKKQVQELAQKILEVKDPVEQNRVAVALLGTQFEDIGIDGVKALADVDNSLLNTKGKADELSNTVENSFGNKFRGAIEKVKEPLAELGEKFLIPLIDIVGDLAGKFADWFGSLSEGQQQFVLLGTIGLAVLSPIIGMVGGLINIVSLASSGVSWLAGKFNGLGNNASGAGGKLDGLKGKFSALAGLASNPVLLAGALVGLASAIGESESAILMLQEKFGNLGLIVGGVCEFISGLWKLTIGQMANGFMFLFDLIAAVIDGPGGQTVNEAFQRYNAKQQLTIEEGMAKIQLSTTRGMSQLRTLQDGELNLMIDSLRTTMDNIPLIVDGEFQQASQSMATALTAMNNNQILALTNMNDVTRGLFSGIRDGMNIDEIVPILNGNFEHIKNSGKFNTEELKNGVQSAMETVRGQLDTKSAEGANDLSNNMAQAKSNVDSATSAMAYSATTGMAQVAGNMIDESGKIPPQIQSNMEQSTTTIQNALSNMAKNIEKSFNDLCYNSEHYLGRIITKAGEVGSAFYSCQQKVYNFASSAMSYVDNASSNIIADWNNVINTLNRSVSGRVSISKTITTTEVTKPATQSLSLNPENSTTFGILPRADFSNLRTGGSSYNITTGVANTLSINRSKNDSSYRSEIRDIKQSLIKLIDVVSQGKVINVDNDIKLDGRSIAKGIATFVDREIKNINKRQTRLGGGAFV
ncbi:hypothetical protein GNF80_10000 [Clostridium perfringens]|nr:hypothetical protein [Clostridium perfringens]